LFFICKLCKLARTVISVASNKGENRMKKFTNTNDSFWMSGPFEAESKEALADEMQSTFERECEECGMVSESHRTEKEARMEWRDE
jgi:hypothetical protein